jgi:NAD-reducing hydrogenase small subunit
VVPVDVFLPGCPPPADVIFEAVLALVEGRTPEIDGMTRFGK